VQDVLEIFLAVAANLVGDLRQALIDGDIHGM
jgi:hypothetical protein